MRANFNKSFKVTKCAALPLLESPVHSIYKSELPIRLSGDQIYQVRIIYETIYRTAFPSHPYPDFCALTKIHLLIDTIIRNVSSRLFTGGVDHSFPMRYA